MSITDELREFMDGADGYELWCPRHKKELTAIADRIDAEHEKAVNELRAKRGDMWLKGYAVCHAELMEGHPVIAADLEKAGWVRLPKDKDGVPIRVGDEVVYYTRHARTEHVTWIAFGKHGEQHVNTDSGSYTNPALLRHYHAPTVEDVLREFAGTLASAENNWGSDVNDAIAKYAAKLRLAEEDA